MNKYLLVVIGAMWAVIFAVGGWWFVRAEAYFKVVDQLQYRSLYFNGQSREAPIDVPKTTPTPIPR